MAAGSTYFAQFFGAAASKASVNGAATLNGALQLIGLGGIYALRTPYTVLTATGGATVNFSSFDGTLGATTARLSENANNVFVTLDPNLLGAATSASQRSIGAALDNFVNNGGTLPNGFLGLYSLSGSALTNAYNQIAGEAGAGGGVQAGTQLTNSFLSLVLNPFGGAPDGNVGSSTRAFAAADRELPPEVAAAYAAVTPRDMRAAFDRRWNA